ncbi:MAG: serine/threonine-protein kinase [Myxococcota bacterium]
MSDADEHSLAPEADTEPGHLQQTQSLLPGNVDTLAGDQTGAPEDGELPSQTRDDPSVIEGYAAPMPKVLGHYVIGGALGRGGMGTVFEGFDPHLDRRVAIKVLHRGIGEQQTARLVREAQAMAKLSHPNVVQVYEVGSREGQTFVAMELIEGRTLKAWIGQRPRPSWRQCVEVYIQAGEGLAAAHEAGLIHRDFKPNNAMIDDRDRVRVLDFGLARQSEVADPTSSPSIDLEDEELKSLGELTSSLLQSDLTRTGATLGTPGYMPLEQYKGKEADARSDQFSFCVALWEAVYGERPYPGNSVMAMVVPLMQGETPVAPKGTKVPPAIRKALLRGLSRAPQDRWPSMDALLTELRRAIAPRVRSRVLVGGVVLGLLTIAGVQAATTYVERSERCTGAGAMLSGIWDDEQRQRIDAAIASTEQHFASTTNARVRERLDLYARDWADKYTEVCEATVVQQEQSEADRSLRVACLQERLTALGAVVDVLATADGTVVRNAVNLVTGLPRLGRCDDLTMLAAQRDAIAPPEDPAVAGMADEIRGRFAELEAMQRAGSFTRALDSMDPLVAEVEGLDYGPLLAETLRIRGTLRRDAGRYTEAEEDLARAYDLAASHDHERVELTAATALALVVGVHLRRPAEGLQWSRTAMPLARRVGETTDVASTVGYQGDIYYRKGEAETAEARFREAHGLLERELGSEHPEVGRAMNDVGIALLAQQKFDEASDWLRRALGILERTLGPDHPHVAIDASNLGSVLGHQGDFEGAEDLFRRAVKIDEQTLGPNHPGLAMSVSNLASALKAQNKHEQAEARYRRALEIFANVREEDRPDTSSSVAGLGDALRAQGRVDEARARYLEALRLRESALGPEHPRLVGMLQNLAQLALETDAPSDARAYAERALALGTAAEEPPARLAASRLLLARALWSTPDDRPRAHELATAAREALASGSADEAELHEVETWLEQHPLP